ncbi:MAG: hypothetical protein NT040_02000 [Bacteroidetes bacterium]|nr:hypothetical protein [Bacteroidota bacterium]
MKHTYTLLLFVAFIWMLGTPASAQPPMTIKVPLDGTENFRQVTEKTEQYLSTLPDSYEKDRFQKHFTRWAYYQSMHLGPAGEFVNIPKKTLEAAGNQSDAPLTSSNGAWTFVGPNSASLNNPSASLLGNGRVDRMAFHPTDPNTIYVGTPAGGLWRTTDGGSSWAPLSNYIPSLGVSGIVVDHTNPNTLYVLTGDGDAYVSNYFVVLFGYIRLSVGMLVSHDAGATWQSTGQMSASDFCGYRLVQNPNNSSMLYAATSDGLYRTLDGGASWTRMMTGKFYDIEFKPGSSSVMYASGQGTFFYSLNAGTTWNTPTFDFSLCATGRVEIAVTPNSSGKVYLVSGPKGASSSFCGFYQSVNSGLSFTRLANTPNILGDEIGSGDQSEYDLGVAAKPTDNQKILTCGLVIYKSSNGGVTFSNATTYRESGGNYIHPDCHSIEYNPLNNFVYAATDGGFFKSTDDGTSWTNLSAGINTAQFYHFDDCDANPSAVLGGCQDNGVKYRSTATTNFSQIFCCDGGDAAIDYTNDTKGFAVWNRDIIHYSNFTTTSPTTVASSGFFPQVDMNTSYPNIIYYSYSRVVKYDFSTLTSTTLGGANILGGWVVRTCPSSNTTIYTAGGNSSYATTGEMFVTANGGTSWSTISGNPGFPATYYRISDIGVNPVNSTQVYACFGGYTAGQKVLYSSNSGSTWTNISYDLPNVPIWSIKVDAANNVYVGGDIGVYYHAAGSTNWEPFYNFLPNVPVSDLAINESADQLLAATFGRGIWKSSLRAACLPDLYLFGNVAGPYFRSASNSINMYGAVTGGAGSSTSLRAGNFVKLYTGFQAASDPGNKFRAYLGPCDSGMPPVLMPEQGMVYPSELSAYEMKMTRHDGTLEVTTGANGRKEVLLRLFADGKVRIILARANGEFIRDIANYTGMKGDSVYQLGGELAPGAYYLYLVVNGTVMHLQELKI